MNNSENALKGIDNDRTEGGMKQTGGRLEEGTVNLVGDEKLQRERQAD